VFLPLLLSLALPAAALDVAKNAAIKLGLDEIVIGKPIGKALAKLDCPESKGQKTIKRCTIGEKALKTATSQGNALEKVKINVHYQGESVNMAVIYASNLTFDFILGLYKTAMGEDPKVEYWSDDQDNLYGSYIWVDGDAEVEMTQTVVGTPGTGGVTVFVSSLKRGRPLNPADKK
jgi:hypothetical protein